MDSQLDLKDADDARIDAVDKIIADNDADIVARNKKLVAASNGYSGKKAYTRVSITVPNRGILTKVSKGKATEYFRTEILGKQYNFALSVISFSGNRTDDPVTISMSRTYFELRERNEFSRIRCMAKADYSDNNKNPKYTREGLLFAEKD